MVQLLSNILYGWISSHYEIFIALDPKLSLDPYLKSTLTCLHSSIATSPQICLPLSLSLDSHWVLFMAMAIIGEVRTRLCLLLLTYYKLGPAKTKDSPNRSSLKSSTKVHIKFNRSAFVIVVLKYI